jgi:hypothetical protein
MKALITKGKGHGKIVEVLQWCNDWFSIEPGGIVSPEKLAFTPNDMKIILTHNNNGTLFMEYKMISSQNTGEYMFTFKRI